MNRVHSSVVPTTSDVIDPDEWEVPSSSTSGVVRYLKSKYPLCSVVYYPCCYPFKHPFMFCMTLLASPSDEGRCAGVNIWLMPWALINFFISCSWKEVPFSKTTNSGTPWVAKKHLNATSGGFIDSALSSQPDWSFAYSFFILKFINSWFLF